MPLPACSTDEESGRSTLEFALRGSLLVFVNLEEPPSDAEWEVYCDAAEELHEQCGRIRVYVRTDGGAPSAFQRKRPALLSERYGATTAIVSDSVVARVITHALSLFNRDTRAFATNETSAAYEYLRLDEEEAAWVTTTVLRLREALERRRGARGP